VAATSKGGSIKTDLLSCQEQYQLLQCVWLLTYSEKYCAKLVCYIIFYVYVCTHVYICLSICIYIQVFTAHKQLVIFFLLECM